MIDSNPHMEWRIDTPDKQTHIAKTRDEGADLLRRLWKLFPGKTLRVRCIDLDPDRYQAQA